MIEFMHVVFGEEHWHSFPNDWEFGGPNGTDPRADRRWKQTTYQYYDSSARVIHTTQIPLCDDQAVDEFTKVANYGAKFDPKWVSARRSDGVVQMLPWVYDKTTDEVTER